MRFRNVVLVSFFDSKQSAIDALAQVDATPHRRLRRSRVVVLSRETDGSCSPYVPPASWPIGAVVGLGVGGILGGPAGGLGGLIVGLYVSLVVDVRRALTRCDDFGEIQDGLAPGHAALVTFAHGSSMAAIERRLARTDAVTVHRFPDKPIEEDLAREVRETVSELQSVVGAVHAASGADPAHLEPRIAAARRKLSTLEAIADRLSWLDRLQFEFESGRLNRELNESPRWRAPRLRQRIRHLRDSHRRTRSDLEASCARLRAAEAVVETGIPAAGDPAVAV